LCSPCSGGHQSMGIWELQEDLLSRRTWPGRLDPRIADLREQTLLANTTSKLLTTGLASKSPEDGANGTTVRGLKPCRGHVTYLTIDLVALYELACRFGMPLGGHEIQGAKPSSSGCQAGVNLHRSIGLTRSSRASLVVPLSGWLLTLDLGILSDETNFRFRCFPTLGARWWGGEGRLRNPVSGTTTE